MTPAIPALLALPPTSIGSGDLDAFAELVAALSGGRVVLVGTQRTASGDALDEFTVAAALRARDRRVRLGVATQVGAGRAPSLLAREATTTQLLGACEALLLAGAPEACRDAAAILGAMFEPGAHTLVTTTASIDGAVNDPVPSVEGGVAVLWRVGDELHGLDGGDDAVVGVALDATLDAPLPEPTPGTLVVVHHEVVGVDRLASAFAA